MLLWSHAEHTAVSDDAIVREAIRQAVAEMEARIRKTPVRSTLTVDRHDRVRAHGYVVAHA
jgi:hypothetical protein